MNEIVSDLVEEVSALAIQSDIDLKLNFAHESAIYVNGNQDQLYRLILNILINAIHYTPEQGKVDISLDHIDHHAIIQIHDNGIGISSSDLPNIFDRFYRVSNDRASKKGGSGLGLAIAMAIAKAHGGDIQVKSEFGEGSTFIIKIPSTFC